jgi:nucleotide-binding universal stress UspA family protein
MHRKILCATDFSPGSRPALRVAAEYAVRDGADLTLLHVHEPMALLLPPDVTSDSRLLPSIRAHEQLLLEEWQKEATRLAGKTVVSRMVEGSAWESVVQLATEGFYDLIVVGTQGRTGLAHALVGSTAERIVRHASCDVLVVRN